MKTKKTEDLRSFEKKLWKEGFQYIVGTDEAGRGPLVGPVVAGAVILPVNYNLKKRNEYFHIIQKDAIAVGVGIIEAKEIDEINIYEASRKAMKEAILNLKIKPEYILSDAMPLQMEIPCIPIIHGDAKSISIAAASVIAKVTRDKIMYELDLKYPEYEFKNHKGYPTKKHVELLQKYGPLENYRFTYKPVRDLMEKKENKEE